MALLPALAVGAAGAWLAMGSHQRSYEDRLRDSAKGVALLIEREVITHISALAALAASPALDNGPDGDLAPFYAHASRAAEAVGSPVGLIGPDLRIWIDTERPFGEPLPSTAAVDASRAVFGIARPTVSDLVIGSISRRPILTVNVPVLRNGRVVAAVGTRIWPEHLSRLLAAPDLSGGAIATITDGRNVITARSQEADRFVGMQVPGWYSEAIAGRDSGFASGRTLGGEDVKLAFQRIAGIPGWTLMVLEPTSAFNASWQPPVLTLLGGGTAVSALALAFAMWLGQRVLGPITILRKQAEAVAAGAGALALAPFSPMRHRAKVAEFEALRETIGRAGATMEASERRHRALAEAGASALWRAEANGSILESRGWEVLTGQRPEELRGSGWLKALHPDDIAPTVEAWRQAMMARRPVGVDYRVRTCDGVWLWYRARGVPILDERGEITEWFGVVANINDRKLGEAALAESEARLRAVVETAPDAIVVMDAQNIVQAFNRGAERVFGYTAAEVIGRNLAMLMPAHLAARHDEGAKRYLCTGEPHVIGVGVELEGLRKDGTVVPLEASIGEWCDTSGSRFFTGVLRDITERRAAEEKQVLLAREVDHRAKNALAVVQSLLRLTPVSEPKAFIAAVEARVAALARAHSLLADGGWAGTDLRLLAEKELAAYAGGTKQSEAVLLDGPRFPLASTAVQPLAMVLHELATNAAKYGALSIPGGKVEVQWRRDDGARMLRIRWIESGGPLVVAPSRRGFGFRLIEATIRNQLGGSVDWLWKPSGLTCNVVLPLARAAAANGAPVGSSGVEQKHAAGMLPEAQTAEV
ncbi:MAG TPA: PAS domain S-box protein [Roseomonas sp.]